MHHLTWKSVLVAFLSAGVLAWVVGILGSRTGVDPVSVPWTTGAVCVAVGAVVLWLAWAVRQFVAGKRPGLDPIKAARTVVLAQASAYTGALLGGGFVGYAISMAAYWDHEPRRQVVIAAVVSAIGALILMGAGWLAERWCRVDREDGDGAAAPGGTLAT